MNRAAHTSLGYFRLRQGANRDVIEPDDCLSISANPARSRGPFAPFCFFRKKQKGRLPPS